MILKKHYKIVYAIIIITSLLFAISAIAYIKNYVGYASMTVNATAEHMHEIRINAKNNLTSWAEVYRLSTYAPSDETNMHSEEVLESK